MADGIGTHARHDLLLVASLVVRDAADAARPCAESLVAACRACATILADLVAIAAATRVLPAVRRERDFRLGSADAVRLRERGWRRLVEAFATARDRVSRPLAMGFTTLGMTGLLIGGLSVPPEGRYAGHVDGSAPESAPSGVAAAESVDRSVAPPGVAPTMVLGGAFLATGLGIGGMRLLVTARRGNRTGPGAV